MATKRRDPDPEGLLRSLDPGKYTDMDRYREFREVFLQDERGKRVLYQILSWAHLWTSSMAPTPHEMTFAEGERNLGLKILAAIEVEPPPLPTKTNRR